jgi:hypothetical protein
MQIKSFDPNVPPHALLHTSSHHQQKEHENIDRCA